MPRDRAPIHDLHEGLAALSYLGNDLDRALRCQAETSWHFHAPVTVEELKLDRQFRRYIASRDVLERAKLMSSMQRTNSTRANLERLSHAKLLELIEIYKGLQQALEVFDLHKPHQSPSQDTISDHHRAITALEEDIAGLLHDSRWTVAARAYRGGAHLLIAQAISRTPPPWYATPSGRVAHEEMLQDIVVPLRAAFYELQAQIHTTSCRNAYWGWSREVAKVVR